MAIMEKYTVSSLSGFFLPCEVKVPPHLHRHGEGGGEVCSTLRE